MAINKHYLAQKKLSVYDYFMMELLFQNSTEDMHEELILYMQDDTLKRLLESDIISLIKPKRKSDHEFMRLRLSKKGKEIYKNAQILEFTEQDEILLNSLIGLYYKIDKPIGNDVQVKGMISWFRHETQYSRKMIFIAIKYFLEKLEEQNKTIYIPTLENLFWKSPNVFSVKWSLANSKLYQFIQENKKELNGYTSSSR